MPNEEMSPLMSGPQAGNPAESPVNAGPLTPGGEDTPTKPTKEKVDKHSAYDGFIENASSSQSTICNLADILNDDKRETAVDAGLVSKKNFSKALQIYNKMTHEKDPSSIINNMYIEGASDALFAQKATTAISGLISE